MARALSESVSFDQQPEPDLRPLGYTPVRLELIEATQRLVKNSPLTLYVIWPEPGDTELVYATNPRVPPKTPRITRGPGFEKDGSVIIEVEQKGTTGLLRLHRLDYLPRPRSGGSVWKKEQPS